MASDKQVMRERINALMLATQQPFDSRLEAGLYIYMADAGYHYGDQAELQKEAKRMAAFIRENIISDRM